MTNTSTETGVSVAPMGLLSRFIGVVTSPKATFEAVVAHPRWLVMRALVTVIVALAFSRPGTSPDADGQSCGASWKETETFAVAL